MNLNFSDARDIVSRHVPVPIGEAETIAKSILEEVNRYNSELDIEHEVGIMLASFGQTVTVNITGVGHKGTKLLKFIGNIADSGKPVELFQHASQINFLLIALPRDNEDEPKKSIGFINED